MEYTEENEQFVNSVVYDLLAIPNLTEEINPLLTKELKEKFQKARERFNQILESFNALPGVDAKLYPFDSDPNALLLIHIPATSLFLLDKEYYEDEENSGSNETCSIAACFNTARVFSSNVSDVDKNKEPSDIYKNWEIETFGKVNMESDLNKEMSITELYIAVQKLIATYLKVLDK